MKYTIETTINLPVERIIELFDDRENLSEWQKGFVSFEHVSGEAGQVGAKSRLKYDMNGRKIDMIETIIKRNLPDEFSGTYDADGVHNIIVNRFHTQSANITKWEVESEFVFSNMMMKIMGFVVPWLFKKQTKDFMQDFKNFAEKNS